MPYNIKIIDVNGMKGDIDVFEDGKFTVNAVPADKARKFTAEEVIQAVAFVSEIVKSNYIDLKVTIK